MNLFRSRQSIKISDKEPSYNVGYLGHMSTVYVRGDGGGVERPVSVLWASYVQRLTDAGVVVDPMPSGPVPGCCVDMKLTVCASGLRTRTGAGTMEFWLAHRIAYSSWQRRRGLFVWIYRHEASKLQRVELRCHVVVCASDAVAETIATSLRQRLRAAVNEYARERTRRQNARHHVHRLLQRVTGGDDDDHATRHNVDVVTSSTSMSSSSSSSSWFQMDSELTRTRLLCVGKHYKPPASPTLTVIDEDVDEDASTERHGNTASPDWSPTSPVQHIHRSTAWLIVNDNDFCNNSKRFISREIAIENSNMEYYDVVVFSVKDDDSCMADLRFSPKSALPLHFYFFSLPPPVLPSLHRVFIPLFSAIFLFCFPLRSKSSYWVWAGAGIHCSCQSVWAELDRKPHFVHCNWC